MYFEAEHSHYTKDHVIITAYKNRDEESVQFYFTPLKIQNKFSKFIQLVPYYYKFTLLPAIWQLGAHQNYSSST